mmetsp:Transcript_17370/g.43228  ORF Transcript_17370/g.43228 Transcript_17370/m.43228 type:complete len:201 (-) Transcript_17370:1741-2343(-)
MERGGADRVAAVRGNAVSGDDDHVRAAHLVRARNADGRSDGGHVWDADHEQDDRLLLRGLHLHDDPRRPHLHLVVLLRGPDNAERVRDPAEVVLSVHEAVLAGGRVRKVRPVEGRKPRCEVGGDDRRETGARQQQGNGRELRGGGRRCTRQVLREANPRAAGDAPVAELREGAEPAEGVRHSGGGRRAEGHRQVCGGERH